MQKNKRLICTTVTISLVLWLCFFFFQQIDLVTADLGRFIKNGEQIFNGSFWEVLRTNFYSFSYSQYPFLNHHWGTGVIFYIAHKIGGFTFLHVFTSLLTITTFLLLFKIAKKESGLVIATFLSLLLIPLMAYRHEIRPEIFSCFFATLFFYILWAHKNKEISSKWLWTLPILEVFWVNVHLYFFLGPAIVGAFLLEKIITYFRNKKNFPKFPSLIFLAVLFSTFINPFGWRGAFYPFKIYEGRGYMVLEEQSIWFLNKVNIYNPSFLLFEIVLVVVALSFIGVLIRRRKDFPFFNFFLASGFAFMACWAIRNITLFAFMSLPILAKNIKIIWPDLDFKTVGKQVSVVSVSLILTMGILIGYGKYLPIGNSGTFGLGLADNQNNAVSFFKENGLQGPIFNNYDIGGYLIYYLFPEEKVFVDNRPETYPAEFFQGVYIPMQEDESVWYQKSSEYGINTVIFYWHDATPWGQNFLINRVQDDIWVPVFVDDRVIIFLKDNDLNKEIIDKFEISKDVFRVS